MKLATYRRGSRWRCGVVVSREGSEYLVDGPLAYEVAKQRRRSAGAIDGPFPEDLVEALAMGEPALEALQAITTLAKEFDEADRGEDGLPLLMPLESIRLAPPVRRPGKIICTSMNFPAHVAEGSAATGPVADFPTAFAKFPSTLCGHGDAVPYSAETRELDYEVEVAAVIGRRAEGVAPTDALAHVLGYCILNDLSARDIQFREMARGVLLKGKNLPRFSPMGPYIVTADEVPDPQALRMRLWVGNDLRQYASTAAMTYGFADLVAYWSALGLEPGDVITSGTPDGVAAFRKPDPTEFYLRPGDVITAEVERLGTLVTRIGPQTSERGTTERRD